MSETEASTAGTVPGRPWLKPWKPGQSGNPGGAHAAARHKAVALARQHTTEGILRLVDLMRSKDHRTALAATVQLLAYGIGKPREQSEEDAERVKMVFDLYRLPPEQLAALYALVNSGAVRPADPSVSVLAAPDAPRAEPASENDPDTASS